MKESMYSLEDRYICDLSREYGLCRATEHSYRPHLKNLIENMYSSDRVIAINEPKHLRCGSPDFIVIRGGGAVPVGYIETKDLGKNLDDRKYEEQFNRYRKSLGNLIITNYLDFSLYEDGEPVDSVKIGEKHPNEIVLLKSNIGKFENILGKFLGHRTQTADTSLKLAKIMAAKAKMLAKVIRDTFLGGNEVGELQAQLEVFKKVLIHDITVADFSDIYAQTIIFGMFVGRMYDKTSENFSRREVCGLIPKSHPFLRRLFDHIAGNNADDRIKWMADDIAAMFLHTDLESVLKNSSLNSLRNDPIFDFYQTFLGEYDNRLRYSRGVWYTPQPAVDFIVRTVDEILQKDFGLKDGLADTSKIKIKTNDGSAKTYEKEVHRVQILDPATGTGTFLAGIINRVYEKHNNNPGVWDSYADDHLLPRLNGFEVLMAPYAVAHLKLDMVLKGTGYNSKSENRLRIYLTNSLEEPPADAGTLFATWLSNEAREANFVKNETPVMVILGNPPYSVSSSNRGKMITDLLEDYKKNLNEKNIQPLSDDYIKFIRFGQYQIEKSGEGILAYICNNGFLDGIIHRQMRKSLSEVFDKIYVLNLHGNARKKEICPDGSKDENIFDIMQGVSINIFVKTSKSKKPAEVFYRDLYEKREDKYKFLSGDAINICDFQKINPTTPYCFFVPKDFSGKNEYDKGFGIQELFVTNSCGIITHNDSLAIHYSCSELEKCLTDFRSMSEDELISRYPKMEKESEGWKRKNFLEDARNNIGKTVPISYRPFDTRFTFYTGKTRGFIERPRHEVMQHMLRENIALTTCRNQNFDTAAFVLKNISDIRSFSCPGSIGIDYLFPLYLYFDLDNSRQPNFSSTIIEKFAKGLKLKFVPEKTDDPGTLAPIDVLDYIYAALHSPKYIEKYKEFLKIDFPKVPYPVKKETFWKLVELGGKLRKIHLLESDELGILPANYPISGNNIVAKINYVDEKVYINDSQYFNEVPEISWKSYIGGYQPAQKWLKDRRGRQLDYDDIVHYQRIINALYLTSQIMKEIDARMFF